MVSHAAVAAALDRLVERIRGAGAAAAAHLARRMARHAAAIRAHVRVETFPQDGGVACRGPRHRQRHLDEKGHQALLASRRLQPARRLPRRVGPNASIRPARSL